MINIDDLTLGQVRQLTKQLIAPNEAKSDAGPWEVGKCYLIRTVTMIQTGRCIAVYPQEVVLIEAAWIADTGRFSDALQSLSFNEVEPFPEGKVIVGRGSVVDAVEISGTVRVRK